MTTGQPDGRTVLYAVLAPSLWATSLLAVKFAVRTVPPLTAAAFRFVVVALVLWAMLWLLHAWQPVRWADVPWVAAAGLFQTTLYFAFQYSGLALTTASNGAVLSNTRPIFVAIIAVLFLRERPSWRKSLGTVVAFAGVLLITLPGPSGPAGQSLRFSSETLLGDFLLLMNALSGAVGLILTKRVLRRFKPLTALVYTNTFGALALLPFAAWELSRGAQITATDAAPWLALIYQALFTTILAHILWNTALSRVEASWAAVFLYVQPVVGLLLSWSILGEPASAGLLFGAGLVFIGTHLVSQQPVTRKEAPQTAA